MCQIGTSYKLIGTAAIGELFQQSGFGRWREPNIMPLTAKARKFWVIAVALLPRTITRPKLSGVPILAFSY